MSILAFAIATTLLPSRGEVLTADGEFFERKIRPVLVEHCYECHSTTSKKLKGGLRVDGPNQFALAHGIATQR